jgi:uncharacterized membrane protein YdcZ (DUF606 family)
MTSIVIDARHGGRHANNAPGPLLARRAAVLLAAVGAAVAVRSQVNAALGDRLHDGIVAAAISFGIGALLLGVLVPVTRTGWRGLAGIRAAARSRRPTGGSVRPARPSAAALVGVAVGSAALLPALAQYLLTGSWPVGPLPTELWTVCRRALGALVVAINSTGSTNSRARAACRRYEREHVNAVRLGVEWLAKPGFGK